MAHLSLCTLLSIGALLSSVLIGASSLKARVLSGSEELAEAYDYVIVGGGTAGLTVGDRLSDDGKTTVLVIEHGELAHSAKIDDVRDPVESNIELWWVYNVTSAPNKELDNWQSWVIIGNVVGGGSAINGMQSVRGTSEDYDRWGSFWGKDSSWTWEGMLPYFKKALHFQPPPAEVLEDMLGYKHNDAYWGHHEGAIFNGWPSFQWPGTKYQLEAWKQVPGVPFPDDSGSGKLGVFWHPTFMDGVGSINRSYARTEHWDEVNHANYHLLVHSKITKVVLDESNRAVGVVFRSSLDGRDHTRTTVKARKEVIISAGSIHTPQVLQLSGIGPRKLLESAGIETKVDLPGVGQHFHDHSTLNMIIKYNNFTTRPNRRDDYTNPEFLKWADDLWAANRTGPWSKNIFSAAAWLPITLVAPDEVESLAAQVEGQNPADFLPPGTDPTVVAGYGARLARHAGAIRSNNTIFYSHYISGDEPNGYITYEHPLSVGTVNINVTHPDADPVVDYRTYSNPVDIDINIAMGRFHRKFHLESPGLVQFQPVETQPGLNVTTREEWLAWMRENTYPTAMHPSGSCAMMPRELGGVVDQELRVYGVQRLRIVDASVISMIPGANICGPVYAIAEKASDMIKASNKSDK